MQTDRRRVDTSRVAAAKFCVDGQWITGGVAYGEACLANTLPVRQRTGSLLQELTRQVALLSGPRFIAGDFNQELHAMHEPQVWISMGFQVRWNAQPSMTCKQKTRKDFLLISPELRSLFESIHVDANIFPDHAALWCGLSRLGKPKPVLKWPKPIPFSVAPKVRAGGDDRISWPP